jgi:hypothetical protein
VAARVDQKQTDWLHIASRFPTLSNSDKAHWSLCLYWFLSRPSALQVLAAEVRAAKQEGKYSEGVSDLPGTDVQRAQPPKVVWTDPWSGLATKRHDLKIDRGVSFEAALTQLEHEWGGEQDGFYVSKRDMFGK